MGWLRRKADEGKDFYQALAMVHVRMPHFRPARWARVTKRVTPCNKASPASVPVQDEVLQPPR